MVNDSSEDMDDGIDQTAPVWAVFGDLMAGLLGAFVLVLVGVLVVQIDLVSSLKQEVEKRQLEEKRRMALEQALAIPLASGRVTVNNGRIGISGSVLFGAGSDQLRPEGRQLLQTLVQPLQVYLSERDEMLMVSGFTDNTPLRGTNTQRFADNLELSAQRALTVARALIDEGMPSSQVFAAAFGAEQPVADNSDEPGRAKNRRVEMAPVPKASHAKPAELVHSAATAAAAVSALGAASAAAANAPTANTPATGGARP
jgi:flagellar motor protein MotB